MSKNTMAKSRTKDNPYEVWQYRDWEWRVLKKYQSPENEAKNEYARWYCFVTSNLCPGGEYGDVYVRDIKSVAHKVGEE